MVALLFTLNVLFATDIKEVRCNPYSNAGKKTFSAKGSLSESTMTSQLLVSVNGMTFLEEYQVVAIQNRLFYKTYFLENQNSTAPSLAIRTGSGQVQPESSLYLQTTEVFASECSLTKQ